MSLLDVRNLQTSFYTRDGLVRAVDDVSFEVGEGETLAIVGESGCGKSVTALSIMRLIRWPPGRIVGGQILFQGRDLLGLPEAEMRAIRGGQIGMIFQEPMTSLNPVLTIEQQIGEAVELHLRLSRGEARRRIRELLTAVEVADPDFVARRYPHQLSGGMRQRVMIAMALAGEPKLLIADEPTTALDVTIQAQIVDLIQRTARARRMAVIMITHNLGVVAGMANRVVVMYAGHVVEVADLRDLYYLPRHHYSAGLLRSIPRIDRETSGRLVPIEGQPPDLVHALVGCAFAGRCEGADDVCWRDRPPLAYVGEGHLAACWHPMSGGAALSSVMFPGTRRPAPDTTGEGG
jgi:oligopeptide/dipeptide ABC transporter ATP-binding protein